MISWDERCWGYGKATRYQGAIEGVPAIEAIEATRLPAITPASYYCMPAAC